MTHTTSTATQVVQARMKCTGESWQMAQAHLRDLERQGHGATVIPEARTPAQQLLEAQLLVALSKAESHLWTGNRGHALQHLVPTPDSLELVLSDNALLALVREIAPVDVDGEIYGIVGLRAARTNRGVVLRILSPDGDASGAQVLLQGIDESAWAKALRDLPERHHRDYPVFVDDPELSRAERDFLHEFPIEFLAQPGMASAMLRRWHLLAGACWVTAWAGDLSVKIEWCHGPEMHVIAGLFRDENSRVASPMLRPADAPEGISPRYMTVFQGPELQFRLGQLPPGRPGALQLRRLNDPHAHA